jgi:phenylalanyl-tRNA synthetase beta chain
MRAPVSWLRDYCPVTMSAGSLADLLTRHGVEIEAVLYPWGGLAGVRVARVVEVEDHPNADKLALAALDVGGEERRVVAGVRNMVAGDLVPYAPPGATLPGFDGPLERRTIRGEVSDGMLCSPKELRISADHSGILILTEGEPGQDLVELFGLGEGVLDIEVFPNRPDLLSIFGVAREVAVATDEELRPPSFAVVEGGDKAADAATVEVLDPERCPRYLARIIRNVTVGPSPLRVQLRLAACGMRPISNVVDATNYVQIETGQPMHPFDLRTLRGGGIVVRRAEEGERLVTLDEEERTLSAEDLVIADQERAIAVAGVVGGSETEVGNETIDVLLESAHFQPVAVLRTARGLGLKTEASIRFERGADPEAVAPAAARAAQLMAEWGGGTVLAGEIDVGDPPPPRRVAVRPDRASLLLGMPVGADDVLGIMDRLGLRAEVSGELVEVEIPGFRVDLEIEADLIEEVGRVTGYDHLPSTLPGIRQAGGLTPEQRRARALRDALVGAGLLEAWSVSFASEADLALFEDPRREGVRVANPVSEEAAYLRTSLLPGLLRAASLSKGLRRPRVRLFEVGSVMRAGEPDPIEEEAVAVLLAGPAEEEWPGERRERDALDAVGILEHLMDALAVEGWALQEEAAGPPYHPGRSAAVTVRGERVGEVGELHPRASAGFDLDGRVAALELRTAPLLEAASPRVLHRRLSRFPPVRRDLAFTVPQGVSAGRVRALLADTAGELLDRALLFDVYEGDPLPAGTRSLAFAVDFRAPDRTLTDEEVAEVVREIAVRLADDLGAELRAG